MRICILGRTGYVLVRRRAESYAARGHDVHVVSLEPGQIRGCTVHPLPVVPHVSWLKARFVLMLPSVYHAVSRIAPDVIDMHGASSYGVASVLPFRAPIVVTLYGPDVYHHSANSLVLRMIVRTALQKATLVIGSTPELNDYLGKHVGLSLGGRLRTRRGGVPVDRILASANERRTAIRREFGVAGDTRVILHSRHIAPAWRVSTIMEAIPGVLDKHSRSEFWFAYPEPNKTGKKLLARLKSRVRELGVSDSVRFLGFHPYDRMISIMHASDVYVSVGSEDLLASSVQEALCTGLVPILSDLPVYHCLIKHGENGFLLSEVSVDNLSDQMTAVLDDFISLRLRVARRNQALISADYDLEDGIDWILGQYAEAIDGQRGNGKSQNRLG